MKEPSDSELLDIVIAADDEGYAAGEDVRLRASLTTPERAMARLGHVSYVMAGAGTPPVLHRIHGLLKQLFQPQDWQVGGVHLGAIMFRDTFARVSIPPLFGTRGINPVDHVQMSELQRAWLSSKPAYLDAYCDQFIDLFDFGYGLMELGHTRPVNELSRTFFGLAHFQFQAAAAILSGAYDFRGAVQSALLGTELSLKAGLAANGLTEPQLKGQFGHNFVALVDRLQQHEQGFDAAGVRRVVSGFPEYVPNRYAAEQPERRQVGMIVMGGQYIAAEVMRQFSDRDLRSLITPRPTRVFP